MSEFLLSLGIILLSSVLVQTTCDYTFPSMLFEEKSHTRSAILSIFTVSPGQGTHSLQKKLANGLVIACSVTI